MASNKKPRKKKPSKGLRSEKGAVMTKTDRIHRGAMRALNNTRILYSSVHTAVDNDMTTHLQGFLIDKVANPKARQKASNDLSLAKATLGAELRATRRSWQWAVYIFLKTGDGRAECDYEFAAGSVADCTLGDLSPIMPQIVDQLIDELDCPVSDVLGWAWIISPSFYLNFYESDLYYAHELIEECDVLNQTRREEILNARGIEMYKAIEPLDFGEVPEELGLVFDLDGLMADEANHPIRHALKEFELADEDTRQMVLAQSGLKEWSDMEVVCQHFRDLQLIGELSPLVRDMREERTMSNGV